MKTRNKRPRKIMRQRNRERVNRLRKNGFVFDSLLLMVLIKLDISNKSADFISKRLKKHIDMLNGNPNFVTTSPSLAELIAAQALLASLIISSSNGDRLLIEDRNIQQAICEDLIRQLSYDIQHQSRGDADKIHSAGFETRKGKSPTAIPAQVLRLTAKLGLYPGRIKLRWGAVKQRGGYVVQISTTPEIEASWRDLHKGGLVTYEATGLLPATVYYFRVYAFNSLGDGPVSAQVNQSCL